MSDIDFDLPSTICAGDVIDLDGEGYISGSDFLGTGSFSFVSGNVAGDALDGVALTFTAANDVSDGRVVVIRYTQDNGTCVTVVESNITVVVSLTYLCCHCVPFCIIFCICIYIQRAPLQFGIDLLP